MKDSFLSRTAESLLRSYLRPNNKMVGLQPYGAEIVRNYDVPRTLLQAFFTHSPILGCQDNPVRSYLSAYSKFLCLRKKLSPLAVSLRLLKIYATGRRLPAMHREVRAAIFNETQQLSSGLSRRVGNFDIHRKFSAVHSEFSLAYLKYLSIMAEISYNLLRDEFERRSWPSKNLGSIISLFSIAVSTILVYPDLIRSLLRKIDIESFHHYFYYDGFVSILLPSIIFLSLSILIGWNYDRIFLKKFYINLSNEFLICTKIAFLSKKNVVS